MTQCWVCSCPAYTYIVPWRPVCKCGHVRVDHDDNLMTSTDVAEIMNVKPESVSVLVSRTKRRPGMNPFPAPVRTRPAMWLESDIVAWFLKRAALKAIRSRSPILSAYLLPDGAPDWHKLAIVRYDQVLGVWPTEADETEAAQDLIEAVERGYGL